MKDGTVHDHHHMTNALVYLAMSMGSLYRSARFTVKFNIALNIHYISKWHTCTWYFHVEIAYLHAPYILSFIQSDNAYINKGRVLIRQMPIFQ